MKLSEIDLSLAVAAIIEPAAKIRKEKVLYCGLWQGEYICTINGRTFNYTTDDALGKMCVWLAKSNADPRWIAGRLASDNPHRAIAAAIVEVSND